MYSQSDESINNNNIKSNDEMIENELIQTNTDYKRDSFDDRVCDDLSEVLLSYLSFEDKFGFECISKQWKSLVFNKQRKLCFNYKNFDLIDRKIKSRTEIFSDILQKCKRINSIDVNEKDYFSSRITERKSILRLITKHCNGLKSIRYDFSGIDMKTIESFGHKFGKSLQELENTQTSHIIPLFNSCHKLMTIKRIYFDDLFDRKGNLLLINDKMENFGLKIGFNVVKQFENFIDKYKNTLRVLSIKVCNGLEIDLTDSMDKYLIQLLKIKDLKELHLKLRNRKPIVNLDQRLVSISDKFQNLEKLSLNGYNGISIQFKIIERFKQLKYLSIDSDLFDDENVEPISIESFKCFKQLTHLIIKSVRIGDDFYLDIDEYLPQLRVLEVNHEWGQSELLTDIAMYCLSELKNIEKILIHNYFIFNVKSFEKLINNNKRMKSIELYSNQYGQHFTKKTIDRLISIAVKRPEIDLRFHFCVLEDIHSYWDQLLNKPNNIDIMFWVYRPFQALYNYDVSTFFEISIFNL